MLELAAQEIGQKIIESNLAKLAKEIPNLNTNLADLDKSMVKELANIAESEKTIKLPENNGIWDSEKGNSLWKPDENYVPPEKSKSLDKPYSNPDNLTWKQILEKYNLPGILFKDGFPIFENVSKGTVEITDFKTGGEEAKKYNFSKADRALAEQKCCSPEDVRRWRKENNYTWHECEDKITMQKVPHEIHANVPHAGGRSQY